jgi:lincosamide nucleotidyltransferase A/C/D/E
MRWGTGRRPREEMTAATVVELLDRLDGVGIDAWLDGGWAVDAVLGAQLRPHDDLDLVIRLSDVEALVGVLASRGYEHVNGMPPGSFELVDPDGRQVDVHPVVFRPNGDGAYVTESGEIWIYPASGFSGVGVVSGHEVRCLTPEVQMLCHAGYEPHRASYDDVWALAERFGLTVPDEYRAPRETYPVRRG